MEEVDGIEGRTIHRKEILRHSMSFLSIARKVEHQATSNGGQCTPDSTRKQVSKFVNPNPLMWHSTTKQWPHCFTTFTAPKPSSSKALDPRSRRTVLRKLVGCDFARELRGKPKVSTVKENPLNSRDHRRNRGRPNLDMQILFRQSCPHHILR